MAKSPIVSPILTLLNAILVQADHHVLALQLFFGVLEQIDERFFRGLEQHAGRYLQVQVVVVEYCFPLRLLVFGREIASEVQLNRGVLGRVQILVLILELVQGDQLGELLEQCGQAGVVRRLLLLAHIVVQLLKAVRVRLLTGQVRLVVALVRSIDYVVFVG